MKSIFNIRRGTFLLTLSLFLATTSCNKYIEQKPAANLAIPSTLDDLQSLLDNQSIMNLFFSGLGEAGADNYYLKDATYNSLVQGSRNMYVWNEDIYAGFIIGNNPYAVVWNPVYFANIVLENISQISPQKADVQKWNQIKGAALFYRARSFHIVALNWATAYNPATATSDLGIPLRLNSNFNEKSVRSSMADTYRQIINDLLDAVPLLPAKPAHPMRPSKAAAYALLSRVYLAMQDFTKAGLYSDSSLQIQNALLDYNKLSSASTAPIAAFNAEVIFHASGNVQPINPSYALIDTLLLKQYVDNDLRKTIFFRLNADGTTTFKGSYFGSSSQFTGLATDEMYLNKSECLVRQGKIAEGLTVLDSLLVKRWKQGTFAPLTASTQNEAMQLVLSERRKELLMRDLRWMDLKRLNLESQWQQSVKRIIGGQEIVLIPGDKRYAFQYPQTTLDLSGIPPNPR